MPKLFTKTVFYSQYLLAFWNLGMCWAEGSASKYSCTESNKLPWLSIFNLCCLNFLLGNLHVSYVTPLQEDPQRPAPNLPWISPHAPFPFADSTGLYPFTGVNHGI